MTLSDSTTIIIADDLTGANDTAFQFFKTGCKTKIIIDFNKDFSSDDADVWAVTTESRNVDKQIALDRLIKVTDKVIEHIKPEKFYKKIDSTLRGHVGLEVIALLDKAQKDAAIIAPAYVEEKRSTLGAYQLLDGIVIDRTQCALDPKAPITESYIPDILKKDVNPDFSDLIDSIGLKTVTKGAGPISLKIKELIQKGKKLIVVDAMSKTDLEQIALAIDKSEFDILPVGSAGLAHAFNKVFYCAKTNIKDHKIPALKRLIVSGSATKLTRNQIDSLKERKNNVFFVDLTIEDIVCNNKDELGSNIVRKLDSDLDVVVHVCNISSSLSSEQGTNTLIDAGITQEEIGDRITDFLSELTYLVNQQTKFILITIGGETSYKCAYKIGSTFLEIVDSILPAIPLCKDINDKTIVTKSGNFGTSTTLLDIINYFDRLDN